MQDNRLFWRIYEDHMRSWKYKLQTGFCGYYKGNLSDSPEMSTVRGLSGWQGQLHTKLAIINSAIELDLRG